MSQPAATGQQMYPCGSCGAQLQFQPGAQVLACPYCGHQQQFQVQQRSVTEHRWDAAAAQQRPAASQAALHRYVCTQCAAHTESDAWSETCQFCGSPIVADTFDPNVIAPEGVLPFQVDQSGAKQALCDWVKSRWFAPNKFKQVSDAESLKSTYLPHWTWDARTRSTYQGERGRHYYEEDSNGKRVRKTQWRRVSGTVQRHFDDVVVPATSHVDGKYLDELSGDWPTGQAAAFQPQYLAGHHTQRYDIEPAQGFENAKQKMAPLIKKDVKKDIGGDAQRVHSIDTHYSAVTHKLLLLPVWLVAYLFGGKSWQVLVSGQTGKVVGERPWSVWKILLAVLVGLVVVAGLLYLFSLRQ